MPGTSPRCAVAWLVVSLAGCAATPLPPITGVTVVRDRDKDALWKDAAEAHARLLEAGAIERNPETERYLSGLLSDLVLRLGAPGFPLHPFVLRTSEPVAASFPNGNVYVSMGMLALLDTEDELAFVLGHEVVHVVRRHAAVEAREARQRRRTVDTVVKVLAASLAVATVSPSLYPAFPELAKPVGDRAIFSHQSAYSQALEYEADALGSRAAIDAGYAPDAGVRALEQLDEFVGDETSERRGRYPSHPETRARIARLRADSGGETSDHHSGHFRAVVLPYLPSVTAMHLAAGRRLQAKRTAQRYVRWAPEAAEGYCLLGKVHRTAGSTQHATDDAISAYEECARRDPARPDAQRELGLLYRATGRWNSARAAFEHYLELSPDAADRRIIEAYRDELGAPP